jgi:hypothetical protein
VTIELVGIAIGQAASHVSCPVDEVVQARAVTPSRERLTERVTCLIAQGANAIEITTGQG